MPDIEKTLKSYLAPDIRGGVNPEDPDLYFRWATVVNVKPLTIRFDGDGPGSLVFADSIAGPLAAGDRVWVQQWRRKLIVMGRGTGSGVGAGDAVPVFTWQPDNWGDTTNVDKFVPLTPTLLVRAGFGLRVELSIQGSAHSTATASLPYANFGARAEYRTRTQGTTEYSAWNPLKVVYLYAPNKQTAVSGTITTYVIPRDEPQEMEFRIASFSGPVGGNWYNIQAAFLSVMPTVQHTRNL